MSEPTLEALMRRMSRVAEQEFDKYGGVHSLYLVENDCGEQRIVDVPIPDGLPEERGADREVRYAALRQLFRDWNIRRYASIAEAWIAEMGEKDDTEEQSQQNYAALGYTLRNAPNREEAVLIIAEDARQFLVSRRAIIRSGQKAYLGKLVAMDMTKGVGGAGVGLLPRPDNVVKH
jgi:hypothetical protein